MIEQVAFSTAGEDAAGSLFLPEGGRALAVIVVHEWWGLNEGIRTMAERFAGEGFLALAVDLYGGRVTDDAAVAMQLSSDLRTERALEIISGAVEFLGGHEKSSGKVGITGFCLGGAMALVGACNVASLGAAVPFYGTGKDEFLVFDKTRVPIQGHYAEKDTFVSPERVRSIHARALAAGASFELYFYDAGHAFMRPGDPQAYDEAAAKVAWPRTIAFLRQHLGG